MSFTSHIITPEPYRSRYRFVMMATVWLVYASFGLCMRSIPPMVTPILNDLDMTYGEMGLVLGSWQIAYIPMSIYAGYAIDRFGIRKSIFFGALIMAISEGLRYFATGYFTMLPIVALFGLGGPLISIGAPKVVSSWFRGKGRGMAVGIYTSAPWIGGLFSVAATNSIIMPLTGNNWRLVLLSYGAVALVFAILWWIFARDTKTTNESSESAGFIDSFKHLIKIKNVRLILIAGLLTLFGEHGFSHWLPKMLENRGFTPEDAGFMAAIPLVIAIPSVLLIPRFVPSDKRGKYLSISAVLLAVSLAASYLATSWLRTVGLVVYGITAPTLLPVFMLVLMDDTRIGSRYMGMVGGIFFCIAQIGGFSGPLLMGELIDMTGSFLPGIIVFTVTGFVLAVTMIFVKIQKSTE